MRIIINYFLVFVCLSCSNNSKKEILQTDSTIVSSEKGKSSLVKETKDSNDIGNKQGELKLQQIYFLFKKVGFIKLPYIVHNGQKPSGKYILKNRK